MHPAAMWAMGPMMMVVWHMPLLIVMTTYRSPFDA